MKSIMITGRDTGDDVEDDASFEAVDPYAQSKRIDKHVQHALEQQGSTETLRNATALKAAVEQYGLTPSLMAFANHDGSLTEALGLADTASLESLSDADRDIHKEKLLASLESYITGSTEGIVAIQAAISLVVLGAFVVAAAISESSTVWGNASIISYLTEVLNKSTDLVDRLLPVERTNENQKKIVSVLKSMSGDLHSLGVDFDKDGDIKNMSSMQVVLVKEKFKRSGITAEVFESLSKAIVDHRAKFTKIMEHDSSNSVSHHAALNSTIRNMEHIDHHLRGLASYAMAALLHIHESASKFFFLK